MVGIELGADPADDLVDLPVGPVHRSHYFERRVRRVMGVLGIGVPIKHVMPLVHAAEVKEQKARTVTVAKLGEGLSQHGLAFVEHQGGLVEKLSNVQYPGTQRLGVFRHLLGVEGPHLGRELLDVRRWVGDRLGGVAGVYVDWTRVEGELRMGALQIETHHAGYCDHPGN